MNSRWMRNSFIYLLIIVAVVAIFFTLFSQPLSGGRDISINEVIAQTARGNVDAIEVKGDALTLRTVDGDTLTSRKETDSSIIEILERAGVDPVTSKVK
ncbi:MAG TPA: ATP-dependent metallopeptidase FtsH/Yme1/Tma family protein, partial [SAR202 cluster bacterium]|nr:ATP-dependent metallopeptidase FtsH/Yme1/Tma family protein [SAR202 cluster bacterium]